MRIERLTGACTGVALRLLPRCLSDPFFSPMTTVRHTEPYDGYYWVVLGGANKAQTGIWINSR